MNFFNKYMGKGTLAAIVGVFLIGIRVASNFVNVFLVVLLVIVGRRYISMGTIIYFVPYGFFVSIGEYVYTTLVHTEMMAVRVGFSVLGCLLLYLGVAIFIDVDMGVDPFTGIVLVICDKMNKEYRVVKVVFDISLIVIGTLLGGKLGIVTVITALTGGPVIQFFREYVHRFLMVETTERG